MQGTVAPVDGLPWRSGRAGDSALARRAATGDGDAFAELYERHEGRAFNLCYRILGSRDDAADATQEAFVGVLRRLPQLADPDFAFGSYLLTSARNACHDLIERRKRTQPSDEIAESATPVGGGMGFDPGDPEDDPERRMLLEARDEEIRTANLTLPERQREVLALRELEELSYDEIAERMDMNPNSVAQLISRARINLRDSLRGTALASIAASSPDCERALPLIALEQDGRLHANADDADWLGAHLMHCHTCRLGRDAMQEAGVSYRAWAPIAAGPLLFRETMARAAESVGADWSGTIARHEARRGVAGAAAGGARGAGGAATGAGSARAAILRRRRRDLTFIGLLTCLLLLVVLVAATSEDDPVETAVPAADEQPTVAEEAESREVARASDKPAKKKRRARQEPEPAVVPEPVAPAAAPVVVAEPAPAETEPRPGPRRPRTRGNVVRRPEGGNKRVPAPEIAPEPEPEPPPPPPDTTPVPPPPPELPPEPPPPPDEPPRQQSTPPCSGVNCPPGQSPPRT
jgi:RNA polymerase sigma factor (sigma-70 family)